MLWMVSASLMPTGEASTYPPRFFPSRVTFAHYTDLFTRLNLGRYLFNSAFDRVRRHGLLARRSTRWRATRSPSCDSADATAVPHLSLGLVLPVQVAMLPLFLLLKNLGTHQHLLGRDHPGAGEHLRHLSRPAVRAVDSRRHARRRAHRRRVGVPDLTGRSCVPGILPILATLAIWTFLATWNDFMWPLIVLSDESHYTLPVALANLVRRARAGHGADDGRLGAHGDAGAARVPVPAALLHPGRDGGEREGMIRELDGCCSSPRSSRCGRMHKSR